MLIPSSLSNSNKKTWVNSMLASTGNLYLDSAIASNSKNIYVSTWASIGGETRVIKYNNKSNILWQKSRTSGRYSQICQTDSSENLYISGSTTFVGRSYYASYLEKYDSNGTYLWGRVFDVTTDTDHVYLHKIKISTDGNNIYGVGARERPFKGYIVKFDSSSNLSFMKIIETGTTTSTRVTNSAIALDSTGNIYATFTISSGTIIVKCDSSGNLQWQKMISGIQTYDIKMDSSNNIYLASYSAAVATGPSLGYLIKCNSAGDILWQKTISHSSNIVALTGIEIDKNGYIYICGMANGYFATGYGSVQLSNIMIFDGNFSFSAKFNSSGDMIWTEEYSSAQDIYCNKIISDIDNNIYLPLSVTNNSFLISSCLLKLTPSQRNNISFTINSIVINRSNSLNATSSLSIGSGSLSIATSSYTYSGNPTTTHNPITDSTATTTNSLQVVYV